MKHFALFLLLICSIHLQSQTDTSYSFMMQPIDTTKAPEMRTYTVSIPTGYVHSSQNLYPVIINLHGFSDPISNYRSNITMDSIAEANNVIMVYPQGDTCSWVYKPLPFLPNTGVGWNAGILQGDFDDVEFINRIIDSVSTNYFINRVFIMGLSNGGNLTVRTAASSNNLNYPLSGAASIIGFDSLRPSIPIPLMTILAEKDTIIRYNGIPNIYPSWPSIRSNWLTFNNLCGPVTYISVDTLPDIDPNDNCWIERSFAFICSFPSAPYYEYKIKNGGHNLPNTGTCTAPPIVCNALGPINNDIDPSIEIWNFFYSVIVGTNDQIGQEISVNAYPNPFIEQLSFSFPLIQKKGSIEIFDINGKRILESRINSGAKKYIWKSNGMEEGIYIYRLTSDGVISTGKVQLVK